MNVFEMQSELFDIIEQDAGPTSYYSMGVEIEAQNALVFGVQKNYRFSNEFRVTFALPTTKSYVIPDKIYRRPLIIMAQGEDKFDDVPSLPTGIYSAYGGGGSKKQMMLYKHEGSSRKCEQVLNDATIRNFEKWENSALIVPKSLFCVEILKAKFDMVEAKLSKRSINVGGLVKETWVMRAASTKDF